jgi:uncharacterized protein (TIGR03083 family)
MTRAVARRRQPPLVFSPAQVQAGVARCGALTAELLRGLNGHAWEKPSRCAGWQARDVAGHLTGLFADVAAGRLDGQGRPEVTARQARAYRGHRPAELADVLAAAVRDCTAAIGLIDDERWNAPAPGDFPGPLRRAMLVLWYELYVHGDDIRQAAGIPPDTGEGLRASVAHVCETLGLWGWGPATVALDGLTELPVRGGGRRVTGNPLQFLLAATGRTDPARIGLDDRVNIYRRVTA